MLNIRYISLIILLSSSLHAQDWHINDIACGTMGFKDSSVTISPVAERKWTKITNDENDLFKESGTSYNASMYQDGLIVDFNGWYNLDARTALSTANNKLIKFTIGINDTSNVKGCIQATSPGSGDIMPFVTFGKVEITDAPDTLSIYFKNVSDGTDITVYCGALRVLRIRP